MTHGTAAGVRRLLLVALGALAAALVVPGAAPAQAGGWRDPSPHAVRRVAVEPGVALEVLDWGGAGEPMVFLPGLGNTAHSFDAFAPRFRDRFRPYAVTPRGFGASSHPAAGYGSADRARDVVAVLDSLGIRRAILVGHSVAGDLLSRLAADHPDRVRALVYLDAYSYGTDRPAGFPPYPPQAAPPPLRAADSASAAAVVAYWTRRWGYRPPEAEVRAVGRFAPSGRLEQFRAPHASAQVMAGTRRSEYARIRAPALAVYARDETVEHLFPRAGAFDAENRRMAEAFLAAERAYEAAQIGRFRREVRRGVVIEIPGANHYVHYTHADEVERAMRAFLARPGPEGR